MPVDCELIEPLAHAHVCSQVQLLKTEGLKAMGAIDDLVDANRLNVQLLASVPAVLLVLYGSRASYALVSVLRTRGLRSMRQVHLEMSDELRRLERCLLLAGSPRPETVVAWESFRSQSDASSERRNHGVRAAKSRESREKGAESKCEPSKNGAGAWASKLFGSCGNDTMDDGEPRAQQDQKMGGDAEESAESLHVPMGDGHVLHGAELGEFALHLHSYLLLLDFSKGAYPDKAIDTIHHDLQDLLRQGQLGVAQQEKLLRATMEKHDALQKWL